MELYAHQKRFLDKKVDKTALVWSCGTGKTRTAIEWAKLDNELTFIICPKALKENWKREAKKWGLGPHAVFTKEEFKKEYMESKGQMPGPRSIIVDECHNGFLTPLFKSQMSKCLRDFIKKGNITRVLLLSATVYTSSPWNIYTLATLLGYKWNWMEFQLKFFDMVKLGRSSRLIPKPKRGVEKPLAALVSKIADVVDINDCMDVPEQLHTPPEYFKLNAKQEKAIEDAYDPVHIVRYTKEHEIENGVLIGDAQGLMPSQFFPCDKLDRIKDLVAENKKVAIVCRYNLQIELIGSHLLDTGKKIFVINGATKNRDKITLEAEAADECVVLIQADCAEGYQLPSFGLCIFASQSYSYAKYEQVCGRFLRMDKPSRTTFIYLMTGGDSIDMAVYAALQRKEDFQIELYKKGQFKW